MIAVITQENFWSKVDKTDSCWNWKAHIMNNGYGQFQVNGKHILAHRFVYELFNGQIPNDLVIDHLCKNRRCVNPEHLEAVTQRINVMRSDSPSAINHRKTHCNNGHPLIEGNLCKTGLANGERHCKTCFNAWQYKRQQRIKRQKMHKEQMEKLYLLTVALHNLTVSVNALVLRMDNTEGI